MIDMLEKLKVLYDLKHPAIINQLESGYKAESFIIQDGNKKFFVKKYHPKRSLERLLEIHRIKNLFSQHGVSTISPLANSLISNNPSDLELIDIKNLIEKYWKSNPVFK